MHLKTVSPTTKQKNPKNQTNPFCYSKSILWCISKLSQTWNNQQTRHGKKITWDSTSSLPKETITVTASPKETRAKPKLKSMMFLNIQVISSYTLVLNLLAKSLRILSLVALYCHTQSLAREKKTEQKRKKKDLQCARTGRGEVWLLSNFWTNLCSSSESGTMCQIIF